MKKVIGAREYGKLTEQLQKNLGWVYIGKNPNENGVTYEVFMTACGLARIYQKPTHENSPENEIHIELVMDKEITLSVPKENNEKK